MRCLFQIRIDERPIANLPVEDFASEQLAREAALVCLTRLTELRPCKDRDSVLCLRVIDERGRVLFQGDLTVRTRHPEFLLDLIAA